MLNGTGGPAIQGETEVITDVRIPLIHVQFGQPRLPISDTRVLPELIKDADQTGIVQTQGPKALAVLDHQVVEVRHLERPFSDLGSVL